jgi:hypothetical protein
MKADCPSTLKIPEQQAKGHRSWLSPEISRFKSRKGFEELYAINVSEQAENYIYTIDYSRFLFNLEVK